MQPRLTGRTPLGLRIDSLVCFLKFDIQLIVGKAMQSQTAAVCGYIPD